MIPAFSVATSATVDPSSWWSSPIGHSTATSPRMRLVASHVPPIPTSNENVFISPKPKREWANRGTALDEGFDAIFERAKESDRILTDDEIFALVHGLTPAAAAH